MKTKSLLVITLLAFTTIFTGCKKYDEGPKFITFRSVKSRLTNGEWKLDKLTVSGIDSTTAYKSMGFSYNFTKVSSTTTTSSGGSIYDYTQTFTYGGVLNTASGYVYFTNHGDNIQMALSSYYTGYNTYVPPIFGGDNGSSSGYYSSSYSDAPVWTIEKLTNTEFWMETTLSGKKYVMKLVKNK
jgi:hypothetical protein